MAKRPPRKASNLRSEFLSIDSNLDSLTADLDRFAKSIQEEVLIAGAAAMAKVLYDEVKTNTAKYVRTGVLDAAVYRYFVKARSSGAVKTYAIGVNKAKAPHWHFLEYGTSRQAATPFIRPAFDRINDAIEAGKARMAEKMSEGVK